MVPLGCFLGSCCLLYSLSCPCLSVEFSLSPYKGVSEHTLPPLSPSTLKFGDLGPLRWFVLKVFPRRRLFLVFPGPWKNPRGRSSLTLHKKAGQLLWSEIYLFPLSSESLIMIDFVSLLEGRPVAAESSPGQRRPYPTFPGEKFCPERILAIIWKRRRRGECGQFYYCCWYRKEWRREYRPPNLLLL